MDTGTLDMLHDTRNQDIGAVADRIYLDLFSYNIFINQNRVILCDLVNDSDKLIYIVVIDADLHTLSSKNVGWSYQNRIAQLCCCLLCLFRSKYRVACRSWDLAFFQNLVK